MIYANENCFPYRNRRHSAAAAAVANSRARFSRGDQHNQTSPLEPGSRKLSARIALDNGCSSLAGGRLISTRPASMMEPMKGGLMTLKMNLMMMMMTSY